MVVVDEQACDGVCIPVCIMQGAGRLKQTAHLPGVCHVLTQAHATAAELVRRQDRERGRI